MGIASTPTKLPLATFAKILGLHPLHFEGVQFTPDDRAPNLCESAMMQYAWQESDRVAREDLAEVISNAEQMIEHELMFHLVPSWDTEEWHPMRRSNQPELFSYGGVDIRGLATVAETDWGYVRTGGIEALVLIDDAVPINWSDEDGDGFEETGTVVVTVVTGTAACQVEAYYPGHSGEPEWQIRPITVTLSGLTATITFRRELAVIEDILFSLASPGPATWTDDADFLTAVDVYRHYNDPSQQAIMMWDPKGCYACSDTGCSLCSYATQEGCLHLRSAPKAGIVGVSPGNWNAAYSTFDATGLAVPRTPDLVRLSYYSGWQAKRGCVSVMDPQWARAVTFLAVALMDRPLCDCTADVWKFWREDLALLSGGDDQTTTYSFDTRKAVGETPFGSTRRGALYAWRRVTAQDVAKVNSAVLV